MKSALLKPGSNATVRSGTAGATITQGQPVYFDSATSTYKLADCNSATAAVRSPVGFALNAASAGQPISVQSGGDLTIGATLTPGAAYYLSGTAGATCPVADLTTGDYPVVLGIAKSASVLAVDIIESGVAL
jgi:urocanate hydratase